MCLKGDVTQFNKTLMIILLQDYDIEFQNTISRFVSKCTIECNLNCSRNINFPTNCYPCNPKSWYYHKRLIWSPSIARYHRSTVVVATMHIFFFSQCMLLWNSDFRWILMAPKKLVSCQNLSFIEWIDFLSKNKDFCYHTW